MLKRIRLKDFKSFVDEEVELAPLTLLVGANASGKSNLLDAIRALKGLASDLTLNEVLNGEKRSRPDSWHGIRGRAEESVRVGASTFSMGSTWFIPKVNGSPSASEPVHSEIRYWIWCAVSTSSAEIRDESFCEEDPPFPVTTLAGGAKSALSSLDHIQELPDNGVDRLIKSLRLALQKPVFLKITPSEMRDYGRRGDPLGEDGHNLSGVLADLCKDPEDKQALLDWLAELCAPEIEDLDFLEVKELGDVMAMFVERGGKRISARSVSDGTLHFLGTLLALRTAEPGSVILIEEIETGLHPTRIRLLVEYLETVTRERDIQVIATTHSPVVLQWLSDESLRNTVVFGRVPEHEGTLMRRLGDLPHFEEVIQKKGIEELFSTGWLEMAL